MTSIVFEEPPASKRGAKSTRHRDVVAQLKARPGEWARIRTGTTRASVDSCAQQIRTGRLVAYNPAGTFEAVGRTVEGAYVVFARYIAKDGDDA